MKRASNRVLADAHQFDLDLEKNGVTGRARLAAINGYLSEPIDKNCPCGVQLVAFQRHGGLCDKCRVAYLEALELSEKGQGNPTEQAMFKIGVVPRYRHCTLANWHGPIPSEDAVMAWTMKPNRDVVLWGPATGAGKTHLGTALLYAVANSGMRCFWVTSIQLAQLLKEEERDPNRPTRTKCERFPLLMLDDWGREYKQTYSAQESVAAVLDVRHNHNLPTIVTTNLDPEGAERYDARTWSRLRSGLVLHEFAGPDMRLT